MTLLVRRLIVLCSMIMLLGCTNDGTPGNKKGLFDEAAVVKVNRKEITITEALKRMKLLMQELPSTDGVEEPTKKELYQELLKIVANEELLLQEAAKRGIEVQNDELQIYLNQVMPTMSMDHLEISLRDKGVSFEDWKQRNRNLLAINRLIKQEVEDQIEYTQEELSEAEKQLAEKKSGDKMEVFHIMVQSPELADLIYRNLVKDASFEEYVNKYSVAPDKVTDGNMGLVERGVLPEELEEAIFKLKKVGELSPVIKSPLGYHIFKLGETARNVGQLEDENVKLVRAVKDKKFNDAYKAWFDKLVERSEIEIDEDALIKEEMRL